MTSTRTTLAIGVAFLLGAVVSRLFFPAEPNDLRRTVDQLQAENATLLEMVEVLERQAAEYEAVLGPDQQPDQ